MGTNYLSQTAAIQLTTHLQTDGSYEVFLGDTKLGAVYPGAQWEAIGRRGTWLGMYNTLSSAVNRLVIRNRERADMKCLNASGSNS